MKIKFTEAQRAAILAGDTELEVDEQTQAAIDTVVEAAAAAVATPAADAVAAVESPATVVEAPAPAAAASELTTYLRAELATANAAVLAANVELAALKQASTAAQAAYDGLVTIARAATGNMQIALGGSATTAAMDAQALVAEHARLDPIFKAKFKIGGVAAASTDAPATNVIPLDPMFAARLAAAR